MATYEVMYSTKATSNEELSFSDIVLVEAETRGELTTNVVNLICKLGPPGSYYVDSIGGNPYEPRPRRGVAKKIARDYKEIVAAINALISKRDQGPKSERPENAS